MKKHLTATGWKQCHANKRACKYEGEGNLTQVLDYVTQKTGSGTSLTPLEAIKEQLANENNGRRLPAVEETTKIKVEKVSLDQIFIGNIAHYENVEARPIPQGGLGGVLLVRKNKLYLIDGYHRMKNLKQTLSTEAKYIIISK